MYLHQFRIEFDDLWAKPIKGKVPLVIAVDVSHMVPEADIIHLHIVVDLRAASGVLVAD